MQCRRARELAQIAALVALPLLGAPAIHAQPNADVDAAVGVCQRVPTPLPRLDCYDRAFPPLIDTNAEETAAQRDTRAAPRPDERNAPAARERRRARTDERAPAGANRAQIVEVMMPSITTTVLVAADGRVFVREDSTTVIKWPNPPFDVDIETSRLGTSTYLVHPQTHQLVRVAVRD